MTTDRTTKALLLAIALGLWTNVASDWLRPVTVQAREQSELTELVLRIRNSLTSITDGNCVNRKIC